jgi:hypothetical protein
MILNVMEIKQFEDSRAKDLDAFNTRFSFLKQEYSVALNSAIAETDQAAQAGLIGRIQQLNSQMTEELRGMIAILSKSPDQKNIDELTEQLIQYQKDYAEIQQSQDKLTTLKLIKNTTKETLVKAQYTYWIYLGVLILLCFIIAYQVFKVSISSVVEGVTQSLSPPS